jgi:hypothetical protein
MATPIRRDVRLRFGSESRFDGESEAEGNEMTKHIFALAAEINAALHFLFAHLEIAKLELAHDLPERLRAHLADSADLENLRNVVEKTLSAHALKLIKVIPIDQVVGKVYNVRPHVYLLPEISRSHRWFVPSDYSEGIREESEEIPGRSDRVVTVSILIL